MKIKIIGNSSDKAALESYVSLEHSIVDTDPDCEIVLAGSPVKSTEVSEAIAAVGRGEFRHGRFDGFVARTPKYLEDLSSRNVDIVIPVSTDLDIYRRKALDYTVEACRLFKPAKIVLSECSLDGQSHFSYDGVESIAVESKWNKPVAVNEAVLNHTASEWIFVLDADVCMDFAATRKLFDARPSQEQVFRPCHRILRMTANETTAVYSGQSFPKTIDDTRTSETLLCGGAFMILRDVFIGLRGFDERFDVYMEDTDLKTRLVKIKANIGIGEQQGYHLYHPPMQRQGIPYSTESHRRRQLSNAQLVTDTVSRIGTTIPVQQATGIDVVIPYSGSQGSDRVVKCVAEAMTGVGKVTICCSRAIEGLPTTISQIVASTAADAVSAAVQASKSEWLTLCSPYVKISAPLCRRFIDSRSPVSDLLQLCDSRLVLNTTAASRVLAGAPSAKKIDGSVVREHDIAIAVRRSIIHAAKPEAGASPAEILRTFSKAAQRKTSCRVSTNKLTGLDLEALTSTLQEHPVPAKKLVEAARQPSPAAVKPAVQPGSATVAVAVQCHGSYLQYLPKCVDAINAQTYRPTERWLVLDNCELGDTKAALAGWQIVKRSDGSPNPGRNHVLDATACDWIWYVDADDFPSSTYLESAVGLTSDSRVGIVNADLRTSKGFVRVTPETTDYWKLRLGNYVSTESLWRCCALREAGGWQNTQRFDDWTVALAITALGWQTVRNPVYIEVTEHPNHRNTKLSSEFNHKWLRSYCVVCLLAGRRDIFADWSRAVLSMSYPAKTSFVMLDNSRDDSFGASVRELAAKLMELGYPVQYLKDNTGSENRDRYSRHRVVAHLYNRACSRILEDVTVFWEDDNIPGSSNGLRDLVDHWDVQRVGGICAVYESRNAVGRACGTFNKDFWGTMPSLAEMTGKISTGLGFIPGGFACYHTAFVKLAMPFHVDYPDGKADGWDGKLSRTVRTAGKQLVLDGTVPCEHRFRGTL